MVISCYHVQVDCYNEFHPGHRELKAGSGCQLSLVFVSSLMMKSGRGMRDQRNDTVSSVLWMRPRDAWRRIVHVKGAIFT